jgi:hypothetical protein
MLKSHVMMALIQKEVFKKINSNDMQKNISCDFIYIYIHFNVNKVPIIGSWEFTLNVFNFNKILM